MPLNTIIIAIIVVVVLVILILVFTGRISLFSKDVKSCAAMGGVCVSNEADCQDLVQDINGDGKKLKNEDYKVYDDGDPAKIGCPTDPAKPTCCIGMRIS